MRLLLDCRGTPRSAGRAIPSIPVLVGVKPAAFSKSTLSTCDIWIASVLVQSLMRFRCLDVDSRYARMHAKSPSRRESPVRTAYTESSPRVKTMHVCSRVLVCISLSEAWDLTCFLVLVGISPLPWKKLCLAFPRCEQSQPVRADQVLPAPTCAWATALRPAPRCPCCRAATASCRRCAPLRAPCWQARPVRCWPPPMPTPVCMHAQTCPCRTRRLPWRLRARRPCRSSCGALSRLRRNRPARPPRQQQPPPPSPRSQPRSRTRSLQRPLRLSQPRHASQRRRRWRTRRWRS
jgi:hypothetical protein